MMQLSELIETHGLRDVSKQTKISTKDLQTLCDQEFEKIARVKTLGFISILERVFKVELTEYREDALDYYNDHAVDNGNISVGIPMEVESKRKSQLLRYVVAVLLIFGLWLFWQKFQEHGLNFKNYLASTQQTEQEPAEDVKAQTPKAEEKKEKPVVTEKKEEHSVEKMSVKELVESFSIEKGEASTEENSSVTAPSTVQSGVNATSTVTTGNQNTTTQQQSTTEGVTVMITPKRKLWFGVIHMESKKREHFIKSDPYTFDTTETSWLVATSSAYFSLTSGEEVKVFNDAKPHYFKIDKTGAVELSKSEFVAQGGWRYW
jgi:hypothetical protein